MNNKFKFMLEYPVFWNVDNNQYHKIFLANVMQSIIDNNELLVIPSPWPSYGVKRLSLHNTILIAFHSYENPDNVWTLKETPIVGLYCLDKTGYSGWSDICENFYAYEQMVNSITDENASKIIEKYRNKILSGITKYEQPSSDSCLPESFVFFPLQVRTDSVAEKTYLDLLDVLEATADTALKLKRYLVVKRHPFCSSVALDMKLRQLVENNPFFIVSNSNVIDLIMKADVVLSANSGVSLEALICEKTVFCFGESEWSRAAYKLKNIEEIENVFLKQHSPKKYNKLLAFLLSEYWVDCNDIQKIKQKIVEISKSFIPNIGVNKDTDNFNFNLEERLLTYQKKYTDKYNQLIEIEKDYKHLKESTQTFMLYTKFKRNPVYYIFYFFRKIIKKLI